MSVFSANINHRSFYWQISALCFVLGLLLAAAWFTVAQIARAGVAPNRAGFVYGSEVQVASEKATQYEQQIKKLQDQKTELEKAAAHDSDAAKTLNKELQETKFLAGLTEVVGPGVQVTLQDSQKSPLIPSDPNKLNSLIHDSDIANVVNELKAACAEALSVNGQRVITFTAIRCVGPVVHVNGVPAAPPYAIQAIGNPETLYSALNLPNGVLDEFRRFDPNMVRVEKKTSLTIPAFSGSTQMRFAKTKASSSQDKSKDNK